MLFFDGITGALFAADLTKKNSFVDYFFMCLAHSICARHLSAGNHIQYDRLRISVDKPLLAISCMRIRY